MFSSNDLILGYNNGIPVVFPKELRSMHAAVFGGTGFGKTKLLESAVRQDLRLWHKTLSPVVVWDPHGSLVSNIVAFLAAERLNALPVTIIDPSRMEYVVCFNPMRARPGIEPATIISGCIDSLLHAWGSELGDNRTPRLETWLRIMLHTIFLSGGTIGDSLALLRSPDLRRAMARAVEDDVARTVWQSAASLKESEFVNLTESFANRIIRMVSNRMLRLALNQVGPSLDFTSVLRRGDIVLISLATTGGVIDDLDARTIGTLLLGDLWVAAKVLGKGETGEKRPVRVYIDEFSRFLTSSMAQGLAESRGYGLQFLFCCQTTTQLEATPAGVQVLNAVLANARTKIIFNVQHANDMETLVPLLYRNTVNVDAIKFQPFGTKTLGHTITYLDSMSTSATHGASDSRNWSATDSESRTTGTSYAHSESTGISQSIQRNVSAGRTTSLSVGSGCSSAESTAESEAEGTTESRATGHAQQRSESKSEARHLDSDYDDMMKIVSSDKRKRIATFDEAYTDNKHEDYRSFNRTIDQTASQGASQSDSESSGLATTRSVSTARARQDGESDSQALSLSMNESFSEGETESESFQTSESETDSESTTVGSAMTNGGGHTDSNSKSESLTIAPMLVPVLGQEALPPQFQSPDEQLFVFSQLLSSLPDRHAIVRIGNSAPVEIVTPTISPAAISAKGARAWAALKSKKLSFVLTFDEATQRLAERRRLFEAKYLGSAATGEPTNIARRIKES